MRDPVLERLNVALQEEELRQASRLRRLDRYFSFAFQKIAGVLFFVLGAVEWIWPEALKLNMQYPRAIAVLGLSLLLGKQAVQIVARIAKALQ